MPDIISIYLAQLATVDLATALCGFIKLTSNWEALLFPLSIIIFFLYSNLKLKSQTMFYLMEKEKLLTKEEIHPFSKACAACET